MTSKLFGIVYGFVALACIAAKAFGAIDANWWLVLLPLWLPLAIFAVAAVILIAFFADESSRGNNPFQ